MKKMVLFFIITSLTLAAVAQTDANGPIIEFECNEHNFGNIRHKLPTTYDFAFTNTGNEELIIEKVRASCGCTTADYTKAPIKPGQKGKITVKYDANSLGSFSKSITVTSNAVNYPRFILRIKGSVKTNNITQRNGRWGVTDYNDEVILPFEYEKITYENSTYVVKKNEKWGVVANSKNIIIPVVYDSIFADGGYYITIKGGLYGIFNHIPNQYYHLYFINDNCIVALNERGDKVGIINIKNELVIPFEYESISTHGEELMAAKKNGKWGLIDKNNKVVIGFIAEDIIYTFPTAVDRYNYHQGEIVSLKINGKWGGYSLKGTCIIPCKYDNFQSVIEVAEQNGIVEPR